MSIFIFPLFSEIFLYSWVLIDLNECFPKEHIAEKGKNKKKLQDESYDSSKFRNENLRIEKTMTRYCHILVGG